MITQIIDLLQQKDYYKVSKDVDINKLENKIGIKISKNQKIIEYSPKSHEYLKNISKNLISKNGACGRLFFEIQFR